MSKPFPILLVATLFTATACTEHTLPVLGDPFPITVPAANNAIGPRLAQHASDSAILSWMERSDDSTILKFSRLELGDWKQASKVVTESKMFVNWADRPAVTPMGGDSLLAHWLRYSADATYAYDVVIARSSDGGETWTEATSPHDDGTPTEHGFVSIYPADGGTGLVWLDGRKMVNDSADDPILSSMTLRGATIASDGKLIDESVLDEMVCECCQTDVAVSSSGPVVIYRDRTSEEVRDIFVSRHLNDAWQPGVPVSNDHWVVKGCPVNGPAIAADGDLLAVVWYSAADGNPIVQSAVSKNAGKTFGEPLVIANKGSLGGVGISLIDSGSYAVSWLESGKDGSYEIDVRTVTTDGKLGPVQTVGRTNISRNVPQMRRVDDNLILAWADAFSDSNRVVSIRVPIIGFYD